MDVKQWFKNQLKLIEIETFSYCNRECWFCPNSEIDRRSHNTVLPEEVYLSILDQLAEIDYAGEVTYSRYNEPLAYKEIILKRIAQARERLPKAKLRTNTNGDYVTLEYIYQLRDAGLDELFIQQYLANDELYSHEKMKKRMLKRIKDLGVTYSVITDVENHRIEYNLNIPGITVHLRARNFSIEGTSRTEKVAEFNKKYVRTQPCMQVFNNMYIDHTGYVMVCCNVRSDIPLHKNGVMAHVTDAPLWEIYRNEKYKPWRKDHEKEGPKHGICAGCKNDIKFTEFLK